MFLQIVNSKLLT